ncbi:MAG: addiction module antidote protein, HigA family [Lentisphaerae bacterium GWF2_57_35]|nr:MAG: addiction module antidote protein, HigA family [Lentisphaerae bacterium GWF2_57_35]
MAIFTMMTNQVYHSDVAIPPGEYLAEVLAARQISQAELSRRMGRPEQALNEIIKGSKAITPETAIQLEQVLGVPAHIWTGMESEYQLVRARAKEARQAAGETGLLEEISYSHLVKMGVVRAVRDGAEKIDELKKFFGVAALENLQQVKAYRPAFRVAEKRKASPYALAAWLRCGELKASGMAAKPYSKEGLEHALEEIRRLTNEPPETFEPALKSLLAECGVALVILPHLPKTYAHGATFWLKDKAVLMMSIRGSWADIFWFSLFHELAHILLHDKRATFIEDGNSDPEVGKQEDEASQFATDNLIPRTRHDDFVAAPVHTASAIRAFAQELGIHGGIVVGRLQHDGVIPQRTPLNALRMRLKWKAVKRPVNPGRDQGGACVSRGH